MKVHLKGIADNQGHQIYIAPLDFCPSCNRGVGATLTLFQYDAEVRRDSLQAVFQCPVNTCKAYCIVTYERKYLGQGNHEWAVIQTAPRSTKRREFDPLIQRLSPAFITIYGQALQAEAAGLDEVCGPGYRKALEFLLKDYLKSIYIDDAKKIEVIQLGACIREYVSEPKLKAAVQRAAWLGNDETHYVRRWIGKDITDLKLLIDLTLHWVASELLTAELERTMPDRHDPKG